jgi:hypothetical protein
MNVAYNYWTSTTPVAELDSRLRQASKQILASHAGSIAVAAAIGIGKALVTHNTEDFAYATCRNWHPVGRANVLSARVGPVLSALRQNGALISSVFVLGSMVPVVILALAVAGMAHGFAGSLDRPALALAMVAAYHLATIAMVGPDAYARFRSPLVPLLAVFAGNGAVRLLRRT